MPRKNVVRVDGDAFAYHVYNRGIAKQSVYKDYEDFERWMFIVECLISGERYIESPVVGKIDLIAYCLMTNHFHFVVKPTSSKALSTFMKLLNIHYIRYFNEKYSRVGALFDGPYRARAIEDHADLLSITKYVHRNAIDLHADLDSYPFSSFHHYTRNSAPTWLNIEPVLANSSVQEYSKFVRAA